MAPKGCCCCNLREGTLAIGITFLVLAVLGGLSTIPKYVQLGEAQANVDRLRADSSPDGHSDLEISAESALSLMKISLACGTVEVLLSVLFNSLLIHGVHRSVPGMLLAWMIYYAIVFTLAALAGFALTIGGIVIAAVASDAEPVNVAGLELVSALGAVFIVVGLVVLGMVAFFWYLWAVVLTYHRQLREQNGAYKREMLMEESPPAYQPYPHAK